MSTAENVVAYLLEVGSVTFTQLFTLLGPGLILVLLLSILSGYVRKLALITFGIGCYLRLFSLVGTTIHEIAHWFAASLFGHEIKEVQLFKPTKEGHLGHVEIIPDRNNLFKEIGLFFVGIAPIIFGTLIIFLSMLLLFESDIIELLQDLSATTAPIDVQQASSSIIRSTITYCFALLAFIFRPEHFLDWRFYLFLYIAFSIGSSISLSESDIRAARFGFIALIVFLFLFNLATLWLGGISESVFLFISQLYAFFYVIVLLVIFLNILAVVILWLPASVRSPK